MPTGRLVLVAVLCIPGSRLAAQPITSTWTGISGNWTNPALWSTNPNFPNNGTPSGATYHAVVSGTAANPVALDAPITIQQLSFSNGRINGPNSLTVAGPTAWSSGTFGAGAGVNLNGGATISGGNLLTTVTLGGTSTWSGVIRTNSPFPPIPPPPVQLVNGPSATLTLTNATFQNGGPVANSFANLGTMRVNNATLENFVSPGRIDVETGTFNLVGSPFGGNIPHTLGGPVTLAAGTTLAIGTATFIGPASVTAGGGVSGAGSVRVNYLSSLNVTGSYVITGPTSVGSVLDGRSTSITFGAGATTGGLGLFGTLGGDGPVTVNGNFGTSGATLNGSGPITVHGSMGYSPALLDGSLIIGAGRSLNLLGSTHTIGNQVTGYVVNVALGGPLHVGPGATMSLLVNTPFQGSSVLSNAGTIRKPAGSPGNVSVGPGVTLDNAGLVDVQAGILAMSGTLKGTGTVSGPVTVSSGGVISPGSDIGVLHMTGPVSMAAGSTFRAALNGPLPGLAYDQLDLAGGGSINLGGSSLSVLLGYAPTAADSFTIINAGPVSGTFGGLPDGATLNAGTFAGATYVGTIDYTPNSVILTNLRPVPEPATWLLVSGAAAAWAWRRRALAAARRGA